MIAVRRKPFLPKTMLNLSGGAAARGKRSPVPDLMTNKPYPTLVGDPDLSWYAGLDPEMKHDDVDPPLCTQASTVE
ncbi:jg23316, partial [Pararge aegeria aegeria]